MKKIISILLFIFISVHLFGQINKVIDSLQKEIYSLDSDSLKAKKYYDITNYTLRNLNDLKLGRKFLDSSLYYSKVSNYKEKEAHCYFMYGIIERYEGNYDIALEYLDKNMEFFKDDPTNRSYALFQVGVIYRMTGKYEKSLKTYLDILEIFEEKKDSFAIASTLNSIATNYGDMDKGDKAIENYNNAKEIFIKLNAKKDIALAYNNIGEVHHRQGNETEARKNILKGLQIAKESNDEDAKAQSYSNLARTYLKSDRKEVLKYYLLAKGIYEKLDQEPKLILLYKELGDYYKTANNSKAIYYYNKALKIVEPSKNSPLKEEVYKGLSDVYGLKRDFEKAYFFQKKHLIIKDSIFNEENIKGINLLQTQFETAKKDKEILQQNLQLQQQKTKYNNMTGLAIFLLIGSILAWFLFQQRQKRKNQEIVTLKREHQIKTLETLIEGEEKERFRIAKELHDGVNGDLSAIKFKLSSLLEMNNTVIKEAVEMIDNSCKQVRAISHNLVPPSLEKFNLIEAVEEYCEKSDTTHNQKITFQHLGDEVVKITKKEEINIFRIIQELVTNSTKHGQATQIDVQISCRNNIIQITVEDDGKGFDKNKVNGKGIGLKNIQSRVNYLNATIDLISNNKGTSTTIEIDKNKSYDN